jgi:putative Mg2+ transporter-C (MgtC) family protein
VRLALTILAALVIGYNRREHGRAAGMRTTLLVCLAASVSMIQVNLLLPMAGRPANSFVINDLTRLPLGILTGVGFIGAGVILRRGNIVVGVTTAATLWPVTVIGLCLGGGQITLGLVASATGVFALWVLKWIEDRLRQEHQARFSIELDALGPDDVEIRRRIGAADLAIMDSSGSTTVTVLKKYRIAESRDLLENLCNELRPKVPTQQRVRLQSPELTDRAQALGAFCRFGTNLPQPSCTDDPKPHSVSRCSADVMRTNTNASHRPGA